MRDSSRSNASSRSPTSPAAFGIFGPNNEMQFAGHPVIGSTFALADDGAIPPGAKEFTFGLGIGPFIGALVFDLTDGYRLLFVMLSVTYFTTAMILLFLVREPPLPAGVEEDTASVS